MSEKWEVYREDIIPKGYYEVTNISQNGDGTKINLESEKYAIKIVFNFVDSFRATDEGRRIRTYHEIKEIQEYRNEFIGYPLYVVEDSEYEAWVVLESAGFSTDSTHYAVMTIDDIVDVVSPFPPEVTVEEIIN